MDMARAIFFSLTYKGNFSIVVYRKIKALSINFPQFTAGSFKLLKAYLFSIPQF